MKEFTLPYSKKKATLNATPNIPTLEITENGVYNVKGYTYADVNVEGGGGSDFKKVNVALKVNEGNIANFRMLFANPETNNVNGVYVTTEDNVRYINSDTHEIELGGESAEEITFEAYLYLNNPIYAYWLSAQSADGYTITGDAETSSFTVEEHTFYAVTISGDCSISVEGTK